MNDNNGVTFISTAEMQAKYYLLNQKVQKISVFSDSIIAGVETKGGYMLNAVSDDFRRLDQFKGDKGIVYEIKRNSKGNIRVVSSIESYDYRNDQSKRITYSAPLSDTRLGEHRSFKNIEWLNGKLYGTTPAIFFEFDPQKNRSRSIVFKNGLHSLKAFNNHIYIGSSEGLVVFKSDSLIELGREQKMLRTPITSLQVVQGYLAIGTDGRGVRLYKNKKAIPIICTDGLMIQKMIKKDGFLWLATQDGVKKLELNFSNLEASEIVDAFYTTDGLLQNNTNDICFKDNFLYAASDMGITRLNVNSLIYKKKPKLYFTTNEDTLTYTYHDKNHVAIQYEVLSFSNQSHFDFRYRLFPFHKEWIETNNRNLNFDGLSPGIYQLELEATDQHQNSNVISLVINIIPEWWQTNTAKLIFILGGIIVLLLLLRWLLLRVSRREQLKAFHEKRLAGLELQALRSQMNPHFVFNSLNAIQYYFQRNEVALSESYLVKFSKLVRLFFEYSRKTHITIKKEIELLKNYLMIEQLRFEKKLNFEIIVDEKINTEEQFIPSMILQPIVENSVNHGLFHKTTNGVVVIRFKYFAPLSFEVSIQDNGVGVEKSKKMKGQFMREDQSNSSTVLKERIELLNQSRDWTIDFHIEDFSANEKDVGTNVSLKFTQNLK